MYGITGVIEGVAPILFSRWTEGSMESIKTGATGGKFTDDQRTAEALEKVYRDEAGLYLPAWNLKKCLLEGAQKAKLKEGRSSLGPYLAATVFVQGDPHFDGLTEPDFIHETPGKRPPKTGGACLIKRPALNTGWKLPFRLMVVDDRRSVDQIRLALEEAGTLVGLGSWRPEYGRFVLTEWQVQRDQKAA